MVSIMEKGLRDGLTDRADKTTIKVSTELRDKLAEIGNKDETFEDVIKRLIRRAQAERSGEIVTSKSSMIQYKRKKEFVELYIDLGVLSHPMRICGESKDMVVRDKKDKDIGRIKIPQKAGIEYDYNIPPKKEGEWELDIKIIKIYYNQKTYNPSEFFGVDNEHKYLSNEFMQIYFQVLSEILIREFGITKLKNFSRAHRVNILEWRKIYYENKLSEESFINDVEDILRNFSERQLDAKVKKQIENSIAGH